MYHPHPTFKQPLDENEKVWRYMDFTKFVSMLHTNSLFFSRADKLGDPLEGSYSRTSAFVRDNLPMPDGLDASDEEAFRKDLKVNWPVRQKQMTSTVAVNCWHLNAHESAAMWRLYLKSNEGIAVQSRYSRLRASFNSASISVYLGRVKYIDYQQEPAEVEKALHKDPEVLISSWNGLEPFVYKRLSFEHEREVRAVVWPQEKELRQRLAEDGGIGVPVSLEHLIERVYLAPDCPSWLAGLVAGVSRQYGFEFEVCQSTINADPIY